MGCWLNERRELSGHNLACETVTLGYGRDCRRITACFLLDGTLRLERLDDHERIMLSSFMRCDIVAVERQWGHGYGVFSDIDFGRPDGATWHRNFGNVDGCDFSAATLDNCRFLNTDMLTLWLPPWPHVVLFDPHQRAADVARVEWPGHLGRYMQDCTDESAPVSATVLHIPTLAKSTHCTPEQVRQAFGKFGGVLM
jgi:hypothetical protein